MLLVTVIFFQVLVWFWYQPTPVYIYLEPEKEATTKYVDCSGPNSICEDSQYFYWRDTSCKLKSSNYLSLRGFIPPGSTPIPIFVMTKDRISVLKETLRSYYETIKTPFEIVIIDDQSTYPDLLNFLDELAKSNVKIYKKEPRKGPVHFRSKEENEVEISRRLNEVGAFVEDFLRTSKATHYIVTDPDVSLSPCVQGKIVEMLQSVMNATKVPVVGVGLRVDDVHPVIQKIGFHKWLWPETLESIKFEEYPVYFHRAPIDTTFAMYHRSFRFRRLNNGIRVVFPCIARHLDFYLSKDNMPKDSEYYISQKENNVISHSYWYLDKNSTEEKRW